jgi:pimeloyl-[acyl-carrier protein] methyl ester esterase
MENIVTFSGWGQSYDALANIAPTANHINYRDFADVESLFASLRDLKCDVLIGWSLGGQLALRAIDAGIFAPKLLVLLATPFQFLSGKGLRCGMDADTFNAFENEFKRDATKTLAQFSLLIAKNDSTAKQIIIQLKSNKIDGTDKWLHWLNELHDFSCSRLNFSKMPKTLSIHGRDDTIVDATQAGIFHPLIKNYQSVILEQCGHAPHLHDSVKVRQLIAEAL